MRSPRREGYPGAPHSKLLPGSKGGLRLVLLLLPSPSIRYNSSSLRLPARSRTLHKVLPEAPGAWQHLPLRLCLHINQGRRGALSLSYCRTIRQ